MNNLVKTPCIGICSTALGDAVCRGCKRINHEVVQWNGYTDKEKLIVLNRLSGFLAQVVDFHLGIINEKHLNDYSVAHNIQGFRSHNAQEKAFSVLQHLAQNDVVKPELETIGIKVKPHLTNLSVKDLFRTMDDAYYELCLAYYEANYLRAFNHQVLSTNE